MMNKLSLFATLLFLTLLFCGCGNDGEIDEALFREYADRFQEEVMPTKEEFKRMAESQIDNLPADEQAEARQELAETLAKWPTEEQFDDMVDKAMDDLPKRGEIEEKLSEISEEGGIFGRMVSGAIRGAIKDAPSSEEINGLVEKSLDEASQQVDSLRRASEQ